ncbi:MAG: hypothetical protein JF628_01225 [Sphingomonas sp.]|nr:hypothetical protein [Sphingomonas sp.]
MNFPAALLALVGTTALLVSCARTGQNPLPTLSTSGRYDNAPTLAEFVQRVCVDASADSRHAAQIVDETGWKRSRTALGRNDGELSMWQWPHVQLVRAVTPVTAREDNVWTCQVEVDAAVAPQINRMETSLRRDVGNRGVFGSQPGDWRWKPSIFTEGHIIVDRGKAPDSLSIMVDYADLKPLKALFGK